MTWHPAFTSVCNWLTPRIFWAYRFTPLRPTYFFIAARAWFDCERKAGRLP